MTGSAATPGVGGPAMGMPEAREAAREVTSLWWVFLVVGIAWIVASLVILQFDSASITTIGIIVGIMFAVAGIQQLVIAMIVDSLKWLWVLFGMLFLFAAGVCFFNPEDTFVGLADVLGFLFLTVGIWWTIRAFIEKPVNPVWWLGLISGLLMIIMAFWTSGQFFIEKAYVLLVFAGIWAMMHGVGDIVRAFQMRSLRDEL
jgi:uncharacterized membrane protein HdeD (DUF308 family)